MTASHPIDQLAVAAAPVTEDECLSPAWLTSVLSQLDPRATVESVHVVEWLQTVATKVRFRVRFTEPDVQIGDTYCVKAYFDDQQRRRSLNGRTEVQFYREIAPHIGVTTPTCVYAAIDVDTPDGSEHSLILMEDLIPRGAKFNSALNPFSAEESAATLTQLAILHAARWGDHSLAAIDYLSPPLERFTEWVDRERLQRQLDDPRTDGLPEAITDANRVEAALLAIAACVDSSPPCLVHGDAHAGNTYRTQDGGMGLIDWQILRSGPWPLDVAYHIAAVLDVDERERSERSLVSHYLDTLAGLGVEPPAADEAWRSYCAHLAYGYYLWAITRMVDRPIINEFMHRLGHAVAYHESFELLGV